MAPTKRSHSKRKSKIGIVGAGFAGAVLARELAASQQYDVVVFDARDHLGGNCHTERDPQTQVMIHRYGPHIFHTSREEVWNYVRRFGTFQPFTNRVKAITQRGVFSLPLNLLTLNQFFGTRFNPVEAEVFLKTLGDPNCENPRNFEEQALRMMGRDLYANFFYGYTKKQWGVEPRCLPASILQRLPIRFSYDDNYYASRFQGIPEEGYTQIIQRMLDFPGIEVHLKTQIGKAEGSSFDHLFYSGPMDAYFGFQLGRLQYRSLQFERIDAVGDFQGNAVLNYCEDTIPYTRIAEHKHFAPWETHAKTVCFREYSKLMEEKDIPYYPLRLAEDKALLTEYVALAEQEPRVTFIGRLGTYRYLDMHLVIGESLELARLCLSTPQNQWPHFSAPPLPSLSAKAA